MVDDKQKIYLNYDAEINSLMFQVLVQVKEMHVLLTSEVDLWPCWFEVKGVQHVQLAVKLTGGLNCSR